MATTYKVGLNSLLVTALLASSISLAQEDNSLPPLQADRIVVEKAARKMYLFSQEKLIKEFEISLGWQPEGHKRHEGDGRTPEGVYSIVQRNPRSNYHRSLLLSYPNTEDLARAQALGLPPGGLIMIHGVGKKKETLKRIKVHKDWTAGCIAVNDQQMSEIWRMVKPGITVEIKP